MGHRLLFVAAIVLGLAPVSASAEGILHRASCSVVRYYVAKYSASMAEAYARRKSSWTDRVFGELWHLAIRAKVALAARNSPVTAAALEANADAEARQRLKAAL